MTFTALTSAALRAQLDHPIVDGDGHWVEFAGPIQDYVRDLGGPTLADRFASARVVKDFNAGAISSDALTVEDRRPWWLNRSMFWGMPAENTLDRATSMLPKLLDERLDEMGIDVSVLYPSLGLMLPVIRDDDLRQVSCRAFNTYAMEQFHAYRDRLIPVAVIPMETPAEALAELDYAINTLGFKAAVLQQWSNRPIAKVAAKFPDVTHLLQRPDFYGLDSEYDYDPVWAKCIELGIPTNFHGVGSQGMTLMRGSISNQIFNRIGAFPTIHARTAAALFLGGVTRRFPTLNIGLLEGGVSWACSLFSDVAGLWSKRNIDAIARLDPANLDRELLFSLIEQHGDASTLGRIEEIRALFGREVGRPENLDEFAAIEAANGEELADLFCERFYFGCEGDDPLTAMAFRTELLPFGRRLKAFYGSDISHWDVNDMAGALLEAHEGVDDGIMTPGEFRAFSFVHPVRLHGDMNPAFFAGTRVEAQAAEILATS